MKNGLFTSESVAAGHPDKLCDRVSDGILDAVLAADPDARVAIECAIKGHELFLLGELTAEAAVDLAAVARGVVAATGYDDPRWGLDLARLTVRTVVERQSPEIGRGVGAGEDPGAGDQGMMFGYACDETPERLPLTIALANRLIRRHAERRAAFAALGPDAKAQVTVDYAHDVPRAVHTVVLSTQHAPTLALDELRELVRAEIIAPVLADRLTADTRVLVNPAGTFHQGGPVADSGLTGRKIMVDTYGGMAPHGGGAFSGKDPTKVDRSAAYAARQLARAVVDRFGATSCTVRVAYAIGEPAPIALAVEATEPPAPTAATPTLAADLDPYRADLEALFRPGAIIRRLDLRRPIYLATAAGGHFGRAGFPWEADDLGDRLPPGRRP